MEIPNSKQQQLTFDKGITNVPSDAVCSDNTLEECVGLIYDNGEHRVIQKPIEVATIDGTLVFIHTSSSTSRNIVTKDGKVFWCNNGTLCYICSFVGNLSVEAIGRMLILSHEGGTVYARWRADGYDVTDGLPDFQFTPIMNTHTVSDGAYETPERAAVKTTTFPLNVGEDSSNPYGLDFQYRGIHDDGTVDYDVYTGNTAVYWSLHDKAKDEAFQNACIGYMEELLHNIKKEGGFAFPFWVRFGIEMYDTSVTRLTTPVLMCPSVRANGCFVQTKLDGSVPTTDARHDNDCFTAQAAWSYLHFYISAQQLTDMRDIIKSIKVYVSQEVRTAFINEANWKFHCPSENKAIVYQNDEVRCFTYDTSPSKYESIMMDTMPNVEGGTGVKTYYHSYIHPERKSDSQIMKDLVNTAVFYELCEIPYEDIFAKIQWQTDGQAPHTDYRPGDIGFLSGAVFRAEKLMEHHALINLTTLTQMPHDDYHSHSIITSASLYSYNARLNMFNIQRKLFDGFNLFSSENTAETFPFRAEVHILTEEGIKIVYTDFTSNHAQAYWFFYPDSRATKAVLYIRKNGTWYELANMALREHPALNGAYYFAKLPYDTGSTYGDTFTPANDKHYNPTKTATLVDNRDDIEVLPNTIITTEVNNPMVYYAEGFNQVGSGKILALATQTVALSSGTEFGAQPLIVFTDRGLWSMAVSKTGLYDFSKPLPREVCSNPKSVTQVDGAVFFASEKGLMVIIGSDVKCVSEQLSGKACGPNIGSMAFQKFLGGAFIAYDYRDSLLWIFNTNSGFEDYCYVYSIKNGTFAKFLFDSPVTNVVDHYPDYLLQSGTQVYSLLKRPNINSPDEMEISYNARMVTRPLKLENAFALKKLVQVMHVGQMEGSLSMRIFAANDLNQPSDTWIELNSLLGTPWKYYRFQYDFTNLRTTDRFAGSVVVTTERRTDKLR